jgi:hypothetical protein
MAKLRNRYRIIDHEWGNATEVGKTVVLFPASNPADLAALITLSENVEPEFAADLKAHIAMIQSFPNREVSKYARECLPHITHEAVKEYAQATLATPVVDKTPQIVREAPGASSGPATGTVVG